MKKIQKFLVFVILPLTLIAYFNIEIVSAVSSGGMLPPSEGRAPSTEVPSGVPDTKPSKPSIPDTFNVGEYLTLPGQTPRVPGAKTTDESKKKTGVVQVIVDVIDLLAKLIGALALIIFIIGALLTVASEGKEDRLEKGKSAMVYALIGVIVALMAFVIVTFVQSIFF